MKGKFLNTKLVHSTAIKLCMTLLLGSLLTTSSFGQTAGFNTTYIILSLNGGGNTYYDLNAATVNPDFAGNNLGSFVVGSNNLILKGAEHNVWKCNGCDLTGTSIFYRIYQTTATPGLFTPLALPFTSGFNNGCGGQDQRWSSVANNINILNGLSAGAYYLEVYSNASVTCLGGTVFASNGGLNYRASFNVVNPLSASSSSTAILCNGGSSTVTVSATGGTGPYTGTGTYTVTAGTYTYTVTDANGWSASTSITVTEPTILTAGSTSTSISCNGGTATVTITGAGGTAPYTGTGNFTVTAGTHSYTVTDANGCTATTSITVTEPALEATSNSIVVQYYAQPSATSSSTSILCNGGSSTVTVVGNSGTAPFTGIGDFTVIAGTYNYTITDANGCTATTSITVTEPTALTASSSSTSISCNGGSATVTVTGAGGTGPYTGTGNFTVTAGTHTYTVTDANGCNATTSITVTEPTALTASSSSTSILCNGGTATVTVTGAGGTAPYTGTGNFTVIAGTYNYTITDANGCTATTSITVTEPTALTASSSSTSISCNGGSATVTVTGAGGTGPYTGTGNFTVTAGTYTYTVTDANGCTSNTTIVVTQPALVNAPTGTASQTFCSTLSATLASIQVAGNNVQWYASNAGGTPLATSTPLVTGTTYYATQTIAGCESPSYLAVTVTVPVAATYYIDSDADGFGNASISQSACTQPTGYVLVNTDCNDAVASTYPGAPELCNNVDDNCSGFVDEGCPSTIAGEEPFNSLSAPSAMYSYCESFYGTLAGAFPSTLAQSTCITGEDRWYNFTTLSTGVTIFVGSNANDIVIELQDINGNVIDVENTVVGVGTEVLTRTGLTVGATYRVGIRNYNSNAQAGGQFSGCIRHLRAGGSDSGTSATWPATISMCNVFKASYCGGTGVQYRYTWTGLTGIAAGQVYTRTQTSDYLTLTSVTPMLPAGCMYNVLVTAIYTIPNGAGVNEVFEMPAANPTTITISVNPLTTLRTSDQCAAGTKFRGAVVASLPWVCGVTNWRWRFTEVNPLTLQAVGLPIEQNRGAASNFINLNNVTALQFGKTYAVQTSPIYTYTGTNYQWGPVTYMCIVGSAGMITDAMQDEMQDSSKDAMQGASQDSENLDLELNVYPNPSNGHEITLILSGISSGRVQVVIYDALGREVISQVYTADATLQTTLNFAQKLASGLYILTATTVEGKSSVRFSAE